MNIYQAMLGFRLYVDSPISNNTPFSCRIRMSGARHLQGGLPVNQYQRLSFTMLYGTGSNSWIL
jgi:hypothetical protein